MIAASAYAFYAGTFRWVPAVLCLLFALLAQVASIMANDYFDYVKGAIKPVGRTSVELLLRKAICSAIHACGYILYLNKRCGRIGTCFFAGWQLIPIGVIIAVFALALYAGPIRWPITDWAM